MAPVTVEGAAMNAAQKPDYRESAAQLGIPPECFASLSPADLERINKAADIADVLMVYAVNAVQNIAPVREMHHGALIAAHMQVSAALLYGRRPASN